MSSLENQEEACRSNLGSQVKELEAKLRSGADDSRVKHLEQSQARAELEYRKFQFDIQIDVLRQQLVEDAEKLMQASVSTKKTHVFYAEKRGT